MSDKFPFFAAESGTWRTTSPNPHIDLSGTALTLGTYPVQTFVAAAADTTLAFDSGQTCTVTIWKDATNFKRYEGATWTDAATDMLDLSAATLAGTAGSIANGDSVSVVASMPAVLQPGGPLGTPSGGTLTNCTGLPWAGLANVVGTAFPGSPTEGQLFYHSTRNVLYQYDGAAWSAIIGYGDISLAINASGDGDPWNTTAGGGATTLANGLAAIPSHVTGNVLVSVRAGNYTAVSLPPVALGPGKTAILAGDYTTILSTTTSGAVTTLALSSSTKASVGVAATLTASAHVGRFAKSGDYVWPIWSNTTSAITIPGDWSWGGNLSTYTTVCVAPASGAAIDIVVPAAVITSGTLDPGSVTRWKLSGFDISSAQTWQGSYATLAGCRFGLTTTGAWQIQFGFVSLNGVVIAPTNVSTGALWARASARVGLYGSMVTGAANTVAADGNGVIYMSSSTVRQTLGAAGVASLKVNAGGVVVNGNGNTVANGNDIQNPVTGGTYAIVAAYGGTTNDLTGSNSLYGTTSADAATFSFIQ